MHTRRTLARTAALVVLAALMAVAGPLSAQAGSTYRVGNSRYSYYAINVYTDSYCRQGREVLPAWSQSVKPSYRSTKVGAYSRVKPPGGSYGSLIKPYVCVRINSPGLTWVRNYSNLD